MFYYPTKGLSATPADLGLLYQDVYFKSKNEQLHGWLLEDPKPETQCLLLLHGNAGNIQNHLEAVYWLPSMGFTVLLFDYRGYGLSQGRATLSGLHEDIHAGLDFLVGRKECQEKGVIVLGQSLGGAMSFHLLATTAHINKVKGLVIDSAFSSYQRLVREKAASLKLTYLFQYPISLLFSDRYSPDKYIAQLPQIPLLFIHGDQDQVVPVEHSQLLYDLAKEPKLFWQIKDGGHISGLADPLVRENLLQWIHDLGIGLTN